MHVQKCWGHRNTYIPNKVEQWDPVVAGEEQVDAEEETAEAAEQEREDPLAQT